MALQSVLEHVTSRTGKMLRPRLLLMAAEASPVQPFHETALPHDETSHLSPLTSHLPRRTLLLATAVEMLHNASLLHDDVIDHSDIRRGQPSVNARWGNATAVLVGDWLLAQIMRLLDEVDDRDATRLVNRTVIEMVEAELLQQTVETFHETSLPHDETSHPLKQSSNQAIKQYLKIIDGKTARLFATACALGNPQYEDFGLHYGRLFQMRDDIADGEAPDFVDQLIQQEEAALAAINLTLPIQNYNP
jgi:octaprenyl-diphosphate synthase